MSATVVESWLPRSSKTELYNGVVATEVEVAPFDDKTIHATPVNDIPKEVEVTFPDIRVKEVHIPGVKGDKGDKFVFADFTDEELESILVRQPPLDPSPVELFDSILSEVP